MRSAARMRVDLVSMSRRRARRRAAEIWARLNRAAEGRVGGLAEQFEGIGGVEVVECLQRGREVFMQRVSQPLGLTGAFPDQRLLRGVRHWFLSYTLPSR